MCHYCSRSLFVIALFLILVHPLHAADFNIKLRKTDINDLKQQLMPAFDQSIIYLRGTLKCLQHGKPIEICLDEVAIHVANGNTSADIAQQTERNLQIKKQVLDKIQKKNIPPEQMVSQLKLFLVAAEKIKQCINGGQTANDLKDCIVPGKGG